MADTTQTLPRLTREQRTALDPRHDADLLAEARRRFALAADAERDERAHQRDALDFRSGKHWPEHLLRQRNQPGQERPCLVIDRMSQYLSQVINAYRRNPLALRVRPKGGGATKDVAEILEGHVRNIEQESEADQAYTLALDQAVGQGLGYFQLTLDYEDDSSFQQVPRIRPLPNRFAVYLDPASTHPAGLDAEWGFVVERWATARFQQEYGVSAAAVSQWCGPEDRVWHRAGQVQVASYYWRVWEQDELVQFPDGTILRHSQMGDEAWRGLDPTWPTRAAQIPTVYWAKIVGYTVLERTRWLGRYIPIIRVEGQRLDLDGQVQRTGMVQAAHDSQQAFNFYASAEAEAIGLAPKAPYLAYAEQLAGYEQLWAQANDAQIPYLLHKAVVVNGQLLPPPQRAVVEPAVQAITQARQLAAEDLKATLGLYDASVGATPNQRSGVAIREEKLEGDATTSGYTANLAWSIRACGLQLLDLLPKLYPGPTLLRQVATDGTVRSTPVNQPFRDKDGQEKQHLLAQGQYEVVIATGPSYATQREMAAERLGQLGGALPTLIPYFADLWVQSLDIPLSDEIAARLKAAVPPEALAATQDMDAESQVAALQHQLKQASEQLRMLAQQLQQSQQTEQVATHSLTLAEQQVATMQTRLADKSRDLALQMQSEKWDFQVKLQENELKRRELELKYGQALQQQAREQERLGMAQRQMDMDHAARMAEGPEED